MNPRLLLHIEGALVLLLSAMLYHANGGGWGRFALLFMAPDISILGYLANARVGALTYNAIHTYALPLALGGYAIASARPDILPLALIWTAHIGFDRMLGFGLKYRNGFKDTHLSAVRHSEKTGVIDARPIA